MRGPSARLGVNMKLITFPQSTYCEGARWALQYARIPFVEEAYHLPMCFQGQGPQAELTLLRTEGVLERLTKKGSISVFPGKVSPTMGPLAHENGNVFADSFEIMAHAAKHASLPHLSPDPSWELEMDTYGDAVRAILYHHFTKEIAISEDYTEAMLIDMQRDNYRIMGDEAYRNGDPDKYPFDAMGKVNNMDPSKTEVGCLATISSFLDVVEAKLAASEGKFLAGKEMGMDDIAFAATSSWIMIPPNFGGPVCKRFVKFEQLPPKYKELVQTWRSRPAGKYVLWLYENCRLGYGDMPFEVSAHTVVVKC